MFTSHPQVVEVYQSGAWWPGELLGWRHDADGTCQVWVRVVLGGVEESAWMDLAGLRLPEAAGVVQPAIQPAGVPARRQAMMRAISEDADPAETVSLPLLRDVSAAVAPADGGAPRSGGRRRAPETGALPAASPLPAQTAAPSGVGGRHRAPTDPGRHRAVDPAMPAAEPAPEMPPRRAARGAQSPPAVHPDRGTADAEPEMLTRPMRLTDLAPRSRRPRVDETLARV